MSGFVVWMTGLSGTGKSTLASLLTTELTERGVHVECLDGDEVRKNLSHGLGFAREDRDRNVRRIGYVARMIARSGASAISAAISPYRALRDEIRSKTENFIEVYCECPIDVLTTRDPKGLYKRALAGEIKNFTGVDDPYEAPESPEVHLRTDLTSPQECLAQIMKVLETRGLLSRSDPARVPALPPPFGGEVFQARRLVEADLGKELLRVDVPAALASVIEFVGSGFLSPLSGFMTEREAHKVQNSGALERGTPWFEQPFVLPLDSAAPNAGDTVFITTQGRIVAEALCEEVWEEKGERFMAGPVNGILNELSSARSIRRSLQNSEAGSASCLFVLAEPNAKRVSEIARVQALTPGLVLALGGRHADAWTASLAEAKLDMLHFTVPSSLPELDERLLSVIARSVGATRFATL